MKSSGGMDVMKSCGGMDLEEWELVADDDEEGFLGRINTDTSNTSLSHVINYFHYSYCPPPLEFVHKTGPSNQLLLLPPPPPLSIDHLKTMVQPPPPAEGGGGGAWEESSIISTLEEEDHDVSSPKFTSDFNQFDHPCKQVVVVVDSEMDKGITHPVKEEEDRAEEGGAGGLFKIWKWNINYNKNKIIIDSVRIGGAICSFAAICIMSLSCTRNINNDQTKLHHHFQIYTTTTTNDHRHKQVVVHRANEALISTGGRIPFIATAARITFGGYYDASASI